VGDQDTGLLGSDAVAAGDPPHRRASAEALEDELVDSTPHRRCGLVVCSGLLAHLGTSFGWALRPERRGARLVMKAKLDRAMRNNEDEFVPLGDAD
jgi:hypothetical protein